MTTEPERIFARHVGSAIFLAVFFLRLLVLLRLTNSQFFLPAAGDMEFYNNWALRILRGHWTDHAAFYGLPLYPYLLAAIYKIAGYSPFLPGFLQAALDAGTALLIYKISCRVFDGKTEAESGDLHSLGKGSVVGICAALGWALFEPAEAYSVILMPTAGLVFVYWFIVWQIIRHDETPRLLHLCSLGIMIGFTAMGVATALFLVPLLMAALIFRWSGSGKFRAIGAVLIFAGVAAGTFPAWIHNCFVARDPVFLSAHSGVNFWIGNNPTANGYPKFPPGLHANQTAMLTDSITTAEKAVGHSLTRSQVSTFWSDKARAWIAQHPAEWLRLLGWKIKNFWNAFQYDDLSVITPFRDQSLILPGLTFGLIAALGLAGMILAWRRVKASRWITVAIFLHLLSLLSVFVTERYRLAAVPGLLILAAYGLQELWLSLSLARVREATAYLALLIGATGFVSLPQKDQTLWALDTYNSGLQALEAGDLRLAHTKLELAYRYSPFNSEINLAQGNLRMAEGDASSAKQFYLAALRLDPYNTGGYNNLGVIALNESRWSLAAHFFSIALTQEPGDAKAHYLLACARYGGGDVGAARAEVDRALALTPDQKEFVRLQKQLQLLPAN